MIVSITCNCLKIHLSSVWDLSSMVRDVARGLNGNAHSATPYHKTGDTEGEREREREKKKERDFFTILNV